MCCRFICFLPGLSKWLSQLPSAVRLQKHTLEPVEEVRPPQLQNPAKESKQSTNRDLKLLVRDKWNGIHLASAQTFQCFNYKYYKDIDGIVTIERGHTVYLAEYWIAHTKLALIVIA